MWTTSRSAIPSVRSPFSATSTAQDITAGLDLSGMSAVMTGGYSGLGLEATRALAAAGARIIVPARRPGIARAALADVKGCEVISMDLTDLGDVRATAAEIGDSLARLDLLMAVAGVMAIPEGCSSDSGKSVGQAVRW